MTRRELRHALSLPVLVATLVCVVLPLPALAQSGQSKGKSQQDKSTHEQSAKKGDADKNQRGNGKSRDEKHDRGRSDERYQAPDGRYNSSLCLWKNGVMTSISSLTSLSFSFSTLVFPCAKSLSNRGLRLPRSLRRFILSTA